MAFSPLSDLELLFGDFGVEARVGTVTTVGIWDEDFHRASPAEAMVEATAAALIVRTAAVPDVAHGQTLTVAGVNYSISGIEPDGDGITRLVVSRY